MIKLLVSSIVLLLCIYPLAKARKNFITENEFFGIFLGNYIYFVHYLLIISLILAVAHYTFFPMQKKFLCIIIPLALLFVGGIGYYNYRYSEVTHTKITVHKKSTREKIRIAFVADLHLTATSNKNLFLEMVEKVNAQKPDVIIFGGDVLQNSHTKVKDDYADVFPKLQSTYGTYTILGNHEYYGNDVEENIIYFKNLGLQVLRDQVLTIDGIHFIARDDIRRDYTQGERKSLQQFYKENAIKQDEPIIVVDHNPQSIAESVQQKADVQLSAHTHAGQFFPYNLVVKNKFPNGSGYKEIDGLHTVVTSGVGVGFWKIIGPWQMPYRFGTRSEISIVDIDFKEKL